MAVQEKKTHDAFVAPEKTESKKSNTLYAVTAIVVVLAILCTCAGIYFAKSYIMFSPEKVAGQYATNTAQLDGYDALKYTILISDTKLGDFIIENYMQPYVAKDENNTAPVLTAEEQGERLTQILDAMYPTFVDLVEGFGFENYDTVFSRYFAEYAIQHQEIYKHSFISTDDMFAAFEGNLATYMEYYALDCESVYGKGEAYAVQYLGDDKRVIAEDEDRYSAGYRIAVETELVQVYEDAQIYLENLSDAKKTAFAHFNIALEEIDAVAVVRATKVLTGVGDADAIAAKNAEWKEHPETITLVKIGAQWYVDFTA